MIILPVIKDRKTDRHGVQEGGVRKGYALGLKISGDLKDDS